MEFFRKCLSKTTSSDWAFLLVQFGLLIYGVYEEKPDLLFIIIVAISLGFLSSQLIFSALHDVVMDEANDLIDIQKKYIKILKEKDES